MISLLCVFHANIGYRIRVSSELQRWRKDKVDRALKEAYDLLRDLPEDPEEFREEVYKATGLIVDGSVSFGLGVFGDYKEISLLVKLDKTGLRYFLVPLDEPDLIREVPTYSY